MLALWDRHPELPYRAVAPWPQIVTDTGQLDWIESVDQVETWLENFVGYHFVHWTWTMWTLDNPYLCSVSFRREPDSLLFLLRWN